MHELLLKVCRTPGPTACTKTKRNSYIRCVCKVSTVAAEAVKVWGVAEYSYIVGTCTVCEVHSEHVLQALFLGGLGGMAPGNSEK